MKEEDFETMVVEFMCAAEDAHAEGSPVHAMANAFLAKGLKFVVDEFSYQRADMLNDPSCQEWLASVEGEVPEVVARYVFFCRLEDKPAFDQCYHAHTQT